MARDAIIRAFGMTRPAGVAVVALLLAAAAANAQEGGTATGTTGDSVTVDLSVLESLGPAPADASRPGGTVRLIPPAGTPSRPAPPPLTAAPPPPPAELTGGTAPPPPVTGATPAPTKSPAETVRREEPEAAPPPSAAEPPAPPSEPPAATAGKETPEAARPPAVAAPLPPPQEPPAATAGKKTPEAPPPPAVAAPLPPPQEPPAATARKEAPEPAPPAPAVTPPPAQSAALPKPPKAPSAPGFGAGATRSIAYSAGDTRLPDGAQAVLRAAVAALSSDPALRIQLKAYAAGSKEGESPARRLSLSRALGIRSFLIKQGVEPTRIDVRALGSNVPDGSPDRVDVSLVAR
jgi:outer membrane protein OmpA-like peptidoglycan-associated protein